tara:strand:- start:229 stop:441 length:213 start_codon:yes stop_codon:yes gene_type:complete
MIVKIKKRIRKAKHVSFLETTIASLHSEIVTASFKSKFSFNKNITVMHGNIENKAKLLKKYNRRLKLILY